MNGGSKLEAFFGGYLEGFFAGFWDSLLCFCCCTGKWKVYPGTTLQQFSHILKNAGVRWWRLVGQLLGAMFPHFGRFGGPDMDLRLT